MEKNNDKPKLRFPGFTEHWEQRKFKNMYEKVREKNELIYGTDKIISVANMYFKSDVNISDKEYLRTYNIFKLGDIAFEGNKSKEFARGRFVENSIGDGIVSHVFDVFRPIVEFDLMFWKYAINNESLMRNVLKRCTKSSTMMTNVVANDFLEESLQVPCIEEQKKIGACFKNIDNVITLHQRKLNHLKDKRKSLLQKMFPKNGEDFPELRFPGFTDAWEQRELNELVDVYDGTHQTPNYTDSGVMFLSVENIKTLHSEKYISQDAFDNEFKIFPETGDILMTRIGNIGTANVVESNEPKAYYVSLALLKKKDLDSYFLKESIHSESVKKELWHRTLHIAFPKKINKNEIAKVPVSYPVLKDEQKKIGAFFKQLDNLITIHQRKLNHLQEQKKSLLQQMFI